MLSDYIQDIASLDKEYLDALEEFVYDKASFDEKEFLDNYAEYDEDGEYGVDTNTAIYYLFDRIAIEFIDTYKSEILEIIGAENEDDIYEIYDIFTNYIDSSIQFRDEDVRELYQNSDFYFSF